MRFSTRTRYGCRALAELAAAYPDGVLSVAEMARAQCLSAKYLEHIMGTLKAAGLIQAVRGVHGGYTLTRPPQAIRLREVFQALEGSPAPVPCVDRPEVCSMRQRCPTRETWVEIKEAINGVLEDTTLQDLAERNRGSAAVSAPMYYI